MKPTKKKSFLKNNKGQGMVEYAMLIMMLSIIFTGLFQKLKGYMLTNPDSTLNQAMNFATNAISADFKNFSVRK